MAERPRGFRTRDLLLLDWVKLWIIDPASLNNYLRSRSSLLSTNDFVKFNVNFAELWEHGEYNFVKMPTLKGKTINAKMSKFHFLNGKRKHKPRPRRLQLQEIERQILAAREIRRTHSRDQRGAFLASPTKYVRRWAKAHRVHGTWQEELLLLEELRLELVVGELLLLLDEVKTMAIRPSDRPGD